MNTPLPILNREGHLPEDGWYQFEVPGQHVNHKAGVVQIIDDTAVNSIVNRFNAEAKKPFFAGLLVDQDHFSLDENKSTEAFGWVKELRNRGGIPEARIEWTDIGEPAVKSGRFKFFSSVYVKTDVEELEKVTFRNRAYKVVRPLALDRLALTNDPNNKGGRPISNRDAREEEQENKNTVIMKKVTDALGLPEGASEDAIVEAIQTLKSSASSARSEVAAVKNRATAAETERDALKADNSKLLEAVVEADLEKHKGVITNRDVVKAQLIANRAGTIALLEAIKKPDEKGGEKGRITNRDTAKRPAADATATDEEKAAKAAEARAARITNRARKIMEDTPSTPRAAAYLAATQEIDAEEGDAS